MGSALSTPTRNALRAPNPNWLEIDKPFTSRVFRHFLSSEYARFFRHYGETEFKPHADAGGIPSNSEAPSLPKWLSFRKFHSRNTLVCATKLAFWKMQDFFLRRHKQRVNSEELPGHFIALKKINDGGHFIVRFGNGDLGEKIVYPQLTGAPPAKNSNNIIPHGLASLPRGVLSNISKQLLDEGLKFERVLPADIFRAVIKLNFSHMSLQELLGADFNLPVKVDPAALAMHEGKHLFSLHEYWKRHYEKTLVYQKKGWRDLMQSLCGVRLTQRELDAQGTIRPTLAQDFYLLCIHRSLMGAMAQNPGTSAYYQHRIRGTSPSNSITVVTRINDGGFLKLQGPRYLVNAYMLSKDESQKGFLSFITQYITPAGGTIRKAKASFFFPICLEPAPDWKSFRVKPDPSRNISMELHP